MIFVPVALWICGSGPICSTDTPAPHALFFHLPLILVRFEIPIISWLASTIDRGLLQVRCQSEAAAPNRAHQGGVRATGPNHLAYLFIISLTLWVEPTVTINGQ